MKRFVLGPFHAPVAKLGQWLNWASDVNEKKRDKSARRVDSKSRPIDLKPGVVLLRQVSTSKKIIEKNRTHFVHSRISYSVCFWSHHLKGSASLHWRWWTRQPRRSMRSSNQIFFAAKLGKQSWDRVQELWWQGLTEADVTSDMPYGTRILMCQQKNKKDPLADIDTTAKVSGQSLVVGNV